MNPDSNPPSSIRPPRFGIFRNWTSLAGLVVILASLFAFVLLFALDSFAHFSNPYVGVLTYLVTPVFLALGFGLMVFGVLWSRWRHRKHNGGVVPTFQIDLSRPRDRKILGWFLASSALFLLVSSTVRDLVAGSGIQFADRGVAELKGVPGEWRLYAVDGA